MKFGVKELSYKFFIKFDFTKTKFMNQINHSSSITTEDHAWEIKGAAGLFPWDALFSLRTPVSVKAGEQVN